MALQLSVLAFDVVEHALDEAKETLLEQTKYNTHFHSLEDLQKCLPSFSCIPPEPALPWVLFEPWLNLVMSSQGLSDSDVHKIKLPKSFLDHVLMMNRVAMIKGHLPTNPEDLNLLTALSPKRTVEDVDIDQLLHEQKFFARLDTSSLKDALTGYKGPLKDIKDLWVRLITSARAAAGIECLMNGVEQRSVYLYLLKWDDNMRPDLEYRVFCGPGKRTITAISQYQWHKLWYHAKKPVKQQITIAQRVYDNALAIYREIILHPPMTQEMIDRGFVFDILEDPDDWNSVKLIELNDFGATSGCGSCLFH